MKSKKIFIVLRLFSMNVEGFTTKTGVADYVGVHRNSIQLDKDGRQTIGNYFIVEIEVNKCKKGFAVI